MTEQCSKPTTETEKMSARFSEAAASTSYARSTENETCQQQEWQAASNDSCYPWSGKTFSLTSNKARRSSLSQSTKPCGTRPRKSSNNFEARALGPTMTSNNARSANS